MKVIEEFEYELKEKIYNLCCKEHYFTCGTNRQYDKMFYLSTNENISTRDLAIMIWTCSNNDINLGDVIDNLDDIMRQIHNLERMQDDSKALARMLDPLDLETVSD